MPNVFDRLTESLFASPDLARAATYQGPHSGDPVIGITVLPGELDGEAELGRSVGRDVMAFEVRVSEVPEPLEGAVLIIDGVTWQVKSRPRYADHERQTWLLEAFEVLD